MDLLKNDCFCRHEDKFINCIAIPNQNTGREQVINGDFSNIKEIAHSIDYCVACLTANIRSNNQEELDKHKPINLYGNNLLFN